MANITDECRTRETATSAGNLVTSAASDGVDTRSSCRPLMSQIDSFPRNSIL